MSQTPHILLVEARFYEDIADALAEGALAELDKAGASHERVAVAGAFEIPAAIAMAMGSPKHYDGFLALGCVIRGETSHYDYVCGESARKLQDLAADHCLALGYGILTCETSEQAWARAAVDRKNKGGDVARACLEMVALKQRFSGKGD